MRRLRPESSGRPYTEGTAEQRPSIRTPPGCSCRPISDCSWWRSSYSTPWRAKSRRARRWRPATPRGEDDPADTPWRRAGSWISQELHDALGHHLTALSLNLEGALQLTQGAAHASVAKAQTLARRLLSDVREIVAESRTRDGINLAEALRTLVGTVPRPQIHLDIPEGLRTPDPERAHTLLRCAQEIVTNVARHSEADNLWISVRCEGETLRIEARDDGRGSERADGGFGIRGMRERVSQAGGEPGVATQPGQGFEDELATVARRRCRLIRVLIARRIRCSFARASARSWRWIVASRWSVEAPTAPETDKVPGSRRLIVLLLDIRMPRRSYRGAGRAVGARRPGPDADPHHF